MQHQVAPKPDESDRAHAVFLFVTQSANFRPRAVALPLDSASPLAADLAVLQRYGPRIRGPGDILRGGRVIRIPAYPAAVADDAEFVNVLHRWERLADGDEADADGLVVVGIEPDETYSELVARSCGRDGRYLICADDDPDVPDCDAGSRRPKRGQNFVNRYFVLPESTPTEAVKRDLAEMGPLAGVSIARRAYGAPVGYGFVRWATRQAKDACRAKPVREVAAPDGRLAVYRFDQF